MVRLDDTFFANTRKDNWRDRQMFTSLILAVLNVHDIIITYTICFTHSTPNKIFHPFELVEDKTLTHSPWTTQMAYPKMD